MLFTQFTFLFVYLPVIFFGYLLLSRLASDPRIKLVWLGGASLVFYGCWDYHFIPILVVSILLNYTFGITIFSRQGPAKRIAFIVSIVCNLMALGFFKYSGFLVTNVNSVLGFDFWVPNPVLPLGISFFTFTQIAYLADVYKGETCERSLSKYVLFVAYFPHLIAGPILHHKEMIPQFTAASRRSITATNVAIGLTILAIGMVKKVVIADGFSLIADPAFTLAATAPIPALTAWAGALAYSLQIYFDFSGYSDMAVGLSMMFSIRLPFNFDSPYKATSIVDFWRRWHITLSRFLRDYVYIPLGGSRVGPWRRHINLFLTMLIGGLWHGAAWTVIVWGALHGLYLIVNHLWRSLAGKDGHRRAPGILDTAVALVLTQFCVVIAWVFFRAENLSVALNILGGMAFMSDQGMASSSELLSLIAVGVGYLLCWMPPNVSEIFARWNVGLHTYSNATLWSAVSLRWRPSYGWATTAAAATVAAVFVTFIAGDGSRFLYFQF